jgi:hypothetical protein
MPGFRGEIGVRGGVRPELVPSAYLFRRAFLLRPEQLPQLFQRHPDRGLMQFQELLRRFNHPPVHQKTGGTCANT